MRWEWLILGIVGIMLIVVAVAGFMSAFQNMGNFLMLIGVFFLIGIIIFAVWYIFPSR